MKLFKNISMMLNIFATIFYINILFSSFWEGTVLGEQNQNPKECKCFFEGVGEQDPEICFIQNNGLKVLKLQQEGKFKYDPSLGVRNAFLFYGPSDEDKEEIARQLAARANAIIKVYDIHEIMTQKKYNNDLEIIYKEAEELAKKENKVVIIYFKSLHKNSEYAWDIRGYIDKYNTNPNVATILASRTFRDIDEPPRSRLDPQVEIKLPSWQDREKNINLQAQKYGLSLSPSYVRMLALSSFGVSGHKIKKTFEKLYQLKTINNEQFFDIKKLFYELTNQNYVAAGASCLVLLCCAYGWRYGNITQCLKDLYKARISPPKPVSQQSIENSTGSGKK